MAMSLNSGKGTGHDFGFWRVADIFIEYQYYN
jgi:hypothetical protein